jgi:C1A family cysteine protease
MPGVILYLLALQSLYPLVPPEYDLSHTPSQVFQTIGTQGDCGTCAAFGTTHAYAMRLYLQSNIDCLPSTEDFLARYNISCDGGVSYHDLFAHVDHIACGNSSDVVFVALAFSFMIYPEVFAHGPIVTSVYIVDDVWMNNVMAMTTILPCERREMDVGHMVVVVGWGVDYWIIKNSWGASWGRGGYAFIEKDCVSHGIAVQPARNEAASYVYGVIARQQRWVMLTVAAVRKTVQMFAAKVGVK